MYIRRAGCGSGVALIHEMQHGSVDGDLVVCVELLGMEIRP